MKTLVTKRRAFTASLFAALLFPAIPLRAQHAEKHAVAAQAPAPNKSADSAQGTQLRAKKAKNPSIIVAVRITRSRSPPTARS